MTIAPRRAAFAFAAASLIIAPAWAQTAQTAPPPQSLDLLRPRLKNAAPTGSVAVRGVQGTPGGPAIAGEQVELVLVHNNVVLDTRQGALDEHGVLLFENLPVAMGVTPVVRIDYAGVVYQTVGQPMDANNRQQTIDVACYELTEEQPDWDAHMRHVLINHGKGGVHVTEILIVRNPSDRTWVGRRDESGKGDTTSFTIPASAQNVTLRSGFHGWCCTRNESGRIVNTLPLMPGGAELSLSYIVPTHNGEATLHLEAPTSVGQFMLVVPADVRLVNESDFTLGGETRIADTNVRYYTRAALAPNEAVHVQLAGIRDAPSSIAVAGASPANNASRPAERRASRGPMILLGAGGGAAIVILLALAMFKPGTRRAPAPAR